MHHAVSGVGQVLQHDVVGPLQLGGPGQPVGAEVEISKPGQADTADQGAAGGRSSTGADLGPGAQEGVEHPIPIGGRTGAWARLGREVDHPAAIPALTPGCNHTS